MMVFNLNEESLDFKSMNFGEVLSLDTQLLNRDSADFTVNYEHMENQYGFSISENEISSFHTHTGIYKSFLETDHTRILIIENIKTLKADFYKIQEKLDELPEDWDVFFPYDGTSDDKHCKNYYILGNRWGTDAYFVSKKGARELLNQLELKQPIDEEIIRLMGEEKLNVYYEDNDFFEYNSDYKYFADREQSIKKAIFNSNAWDEQDLILAEEILKELSAISESLNLELILSDGTLLGQIRHGGIMPWDDDVDVAIDESRLDELLRSLELSPRLTFQKCYWTPKKYLFYKVWIKDGAKIPGYDYCFPFVDVWLFKKEDHQIVFNHGVSYPLDYVYPLKQVQFHHSTFHIPLCADLCLDLTFNDWRQQISIFPWSHKHEMPFFMPLKLKIATNQDGRIIENQEINENA